MPRMERRADDELALERKAMHVISGEKILVTGVTGMVARPLAEFLAAENEVWGGARFSGSTAGAESSVEEDLRASGIRPVSIDVGAGRFDDLPDDFTYVLHLAWMRADIAHLSEALRTNAEGTGLLLQHCRRAKASLVMSSTAVYSANPDPWHLFTEDDPLGQGPTGQTAQSSPASKLGTEVVARFCARAFDMPVTIARLNTFSGTTSSFPAMHIRAVLNDAAIPAPNDPNPHSPIDVEDMKIQLESLLDAASTPALITNWCGDEVVTSQDWVREASRLSGKQGQLLVSPVPGSPPGAAGDPTLRRSITGPCQVKFADSFARLYEQLTDVQPTKTAD